MPSRKSFVFCFSSFPLFLPPFTDRVGLSRIPALEVGCEKKLVSYCFAESVRGERSFAWRSRLKNGQSPNRINSLSSYSSKSSG